MKIERTKMLSGCMTGLNVPHVDTLEVVKPGSLALGGANSETLRLRTAENSWRDVARLDTVNTVDPFKSKVALLLNFDGIPGSTDFKDDSGQLTFSYHRGWPEFDASRPLYRSTSMRIRTVGQGLKPLGRTVHPAWLLGTKTFTIEAWVWLESLDRVHYIMTNWGDSASNRAFSFHIRAGGSLACTMNLESTYAGILEDTSGNLVEIGKWQHIAVARVGRNVTFFVNGKKGSTERLVNSEAIRTGIADGLSIGCLSEMSGLSNGLVGNIGQLCVTWAERYTEDFTPNTAHYAYP